MADRAYTLESPQTLEEFLAKYKDAINANGEFIPGKANLNYDGLKAADVYQQELGGYTLPYFDSNGQYDASRQGTTIPASASVNADWIEDPRAKGWIAQHPTGALIAGTVLGGVGASMMGLLGSGATGTASTAFGGPGSFAGANAVGAGDLAIQAMPQVTAQSLGMTGAQAAGAGALGGATSGLLSAPTMAAPNAVTAADLALTPMPQVTTSSLGAGAGSAAATGAGLMGDAYMPANLGANGSEMGGLQGLKGTVMNGVSSLTGGVKALNDLTGGNLGAIAGGLLGAAAGQDSTTSTTSQKDPWAPAQPYLLDNLKKNAALQEQYAQNPFSDQQKAAYQNSFNNSDNFRNNVAPGLLNMVNSFQPYQRQASGVGQGAQRPQQQTGLLSPNMQAPQGQSIGQVDWSKFLPRG